MVKHEPIYFAPLKKFGGGYLLFKDSPSPPATPDYAGAAQAQGAANVDTARTQGRMNNPNIYTPYGSQTVTWGGNGSYLWNGKNYADENALRQDLQGYASQNGYSPDAVNSWMADPTKYGITRANGTQDQPTITQSLAPAQQQILDSQNRISQNLANVAEEGLSRVGNGFARSFDTSQLPGQASGVNSGTFTSGVGYTPAQTGYNSGGDVRYSSGYNQPVTNNFNAGPSARTSIDYGSPIQSSYNSGGQIQSSTGYNAPLQNQVADAGRQQTTLSPSGQIQTSFDPGGRQQTSFNQGGQVQSGLDFSGAPQLPGTNDFSADRDAVTNAMLSRIEPQFQRDEQLMRTRLMNQGIAAGAEASNYDLDTLNRARNDARQQAILAGGQEQSRLFGLASQARNQFTGERAQQGNFANNAQAQQFNQGLAGGNFANAAQQAQYAQNLGSMQANNAAQAQQFGQTLNAGEFANAAQQNQFGQNLAGGQFANAAQSQGFNQAQANLVANNAAQAQANQQALQAGQFANAAQSQGFGQAQAGLNAYNQGLAQNYQQNLGQAQFQNQAQAQGYDQAQNALAAYNAAQAQANAQNQSAAGFANQAYQQNFGMEQQNAALNNQVAQQLFQQGLANANLTNQARQQAIQEQAYLRSLPLNELNALRTGAQVTTPQFSQFNPTQIGQTPVFGAMQAQAQGNQNLYNAQQGAANSFNSGLMGIGGMAAGGWAGSPAGSAALASLFSDRRLKSNIVRIGTHPLGIGIYEYDIFGHRTVGVMADEVQAVAPSVVTIGGGGYAMVDYGRL